MISLTIIDTINVHLIWKTLSSGLNKRTQDNIEMYKIILCPLLCLMIDAQDK